MGLDLIIVIVYYEVRQTVLDRQGGKFTLCHCFHVMPLKGGAFEDRRYITIVSHYLLFHEWAITAGNLSVPLLSVGKGASEHQI